MTVYKTCNVGPFRSVLINEFRQLSILLRCPRSASHEVVKLLARDINDLLSVAVRAFGKDPMPQLGVSRSSSSSTSGVDELSQKLALTPKKKKK